MYGVSIGLSGVVIAGGMATHAGPDGSGCTNPIRQQSCLRQSLRGCSPGVNQAAQDVIRRGAVGGIAAGIRRLGAEAAGPKDRRIRCSGRSDKGSPWTTLRSAFLCPWVMDVDPAVDGSGEVPMHRSVSTLGAGVTRPEGMEVTSAS